MKEIILAVLCIAMSGCASMMRTFNDDPVRATNIGVKDRAAVSTISLDSSRRNVVVGLDGGNFGKFCAEPPPDTASTIESLLKLTGKVDGGAGSQIAKADIGIDDTYKNTAVVLVARTELLDIYRTGTFSLCQLHLNGAISQQKAEELFEKMTVSVISASGKNDAKVSP